MIDVPVANELMMWLTGGSAQMEANIVWKQKVDGRSDEEVMISMVGRGW